MKTEALWWLLVNLLTVVIMSFYSMVEMACVSFNKVRFHYYISKGNKRAQWLNYLMENPSYLFGTTLIGVNVTMMIGSECARKFYASLGYSPDWAPLTQILLVITVGELAPMFAARRYSEHVTMLGIPILYASAMVMKPLLVGIDLITQFVDWIIGRRTKEHTNIYLSREELQKIIEDQEDSGSSSDSEDFNAIVSNIFSLRTRDARQVMEPLVPKQVIASNSTVAHVRGILEKEQISYLPIFQRDPTNIVGMIFARDLIRANELDQVRNYARPPWFLTEDAKVMDILSQFRHNNQTVAIVLNSKGQAVGMLNLDAVLEEIFGKTQRKLSAAPELVPKRGRLIEKTISGDLLVEEFCKQFNVPIVAPAGETISQLFLRTLGHHPEGGESINFSGYKLTVKETSLLGAKSVVVTNFF
jgi:putative hemolysin